MAVNLIDLLKSEFSSDVVSQVASFIGENPAATQKAVGAALPALLGAMSNKAATSQGAGELFSMLDKGGFGTNQLGSLASILGGTSGAADLVKMGGPLLGSLLGARQGGVVDFLSSFAGIGKASSSSLLSMALPIVMNLVSKQAKSSGGFNLSALTSLLGSQAPFLSAAAPAGLTTALGLASFGDQRAPAPAPRPAAYQAPAPQPPADSGLGWLKWVLPLLLLGLLFFGWRACRTEPVREAAVTGGEAVARAGDAAVKAGEAAVATATDAANALGAFVRRAIPGGVELNVPENGIESRLIAFIGDAARPVDDTTWFSFDRLEFETGSAVLKPMSQEQLGNIAAIMKAFPQVDIKVGGYTDNVGDPAANLKLSQERANNTMAELVKLGVPAARMTAQGYGEQHPVASNDTEEGRQRNRRIDVRVTKK
jgi:outer membrane protein OmpA-like peptidoglycan-associated protein